MPNSPEQATSARRRVQNEHGLHALSLPPSKQLLLSSPSVCTANCSLSFFQRRKSTQKPRGQGPSTSKTGCAIAESDPAFSAGPACSSYGRHSNIGVRRRGIALRCHYESNLD